MNHCAGVKWRLEVCGRVLAFGLVVSAGLSVYAQGELEPVVVDGWVYVRLPEAGTNTFRIVESSTNLTGRWRAQTRSYGLDWEPGVSATLPLVQDGSELALEDEANVSHRFFRITSTPVVSMGTSNSVARFLQQASFGPTRALIQAFPGLEDPDLNAAPYSFYAQWIEDQIALPATSHRAYWRERSNPAFVDEPLNADLFEVGHNPVYGHQFGYNIGNTMYHPSTNDAVAAGRDPRDVSFGRTKMKQLVWYQAVMNADDVLRQRMAWALSQIFVVGEDGSNELGTVERWLLYYDIFVRHAFGNFRDILGEVTYSPHMGRYLTYVNNRAYHVSQTFPDENYAREVMQLFTIGLWELNADGTLQLDAQGEAIPTYSNDDIMEFARVFTGLRRVEVRSNIEVQSDNYIDPMEIYVPWHDFDAKTLLDGSTHGPFLETAEGGMQDVDGLLDYLFAHDNTPAFIARRLIQRFTISNPSPNYTYAVAEAFRTGLYNGVGSGERGDLGAVVRAILLHPEAREAALQYDPAHGRLREPLIRLLSYARAFEIQSLQTYGFFPFDFMDELIFQSPFDSPSVFNFYLPDYQPAGELLDQELVAPEFQIHSDITAITLPNALRTLAYEGIRRPIGPRNFLQGELDLSYETTLADQPDALLDHLDMMLTAGRLTPENRATVRGVLDGMPVGTEEERLERVQQALALFALLPEFNVLY